MDGRPHRFAFGGEKKRPTANGMRSRFSFCFYCQEYGPDRYERLVIDLNPAAKDVGRVGIAAGHLKDWPHKGKRALSKKPDWCVK